MFQQRQQTSVRPLPLLRMQQGLHMLQAPIAELSSYVIQELIDNPFFDLSSLEEEERSQYSSSFADLESSPSQPESLISHILSQIHQAFHTQEDIRIAYHIAGNLSDEGLFLEPVDLLAEQLHVSENRIYTVWGNMQKFHPSGICSPSLKSYWLMRLQDTPHQKAYQIISQCYSALTECNFPVIMKRFGITFKELREILKQALGSIPWCPAAGYHASSHLPSPPPPDIYVMYSQGWEIRVNSRGLPAIKLNTQAIQLYDDLPKEDKKLLTQQILSAKWLIKNLMKREHTLFSLVQKLLPYQEEFLLGRVSSPRPLTIKKIAEELECHETTIFRAVQNKSLASPIGILPLKLLFPRAVVTEESPLSKETILHWIRQWIATETSPLSDQSLSEKIAEKGIPCARRTVAKYRSQLKIPPAHKRKILQM
ncbi:RNA polymerase factor sigma-54 [Chlamydia pecorum]|uniref:RNA polymerase factor sigma-54 n=1 Tax=Chlamydia pecorum TaxID=85991 RepID=UPI0003AE6C6F|nr:RNA polymerase factor sigma-54 [Chlamydia pecorum]AGW40264.1 RNA polymerase factor sigma-54 [Chlamydia pecorum P787]